jgi:hypothetical protein
VKISLMTAVHDKPAETLDRVLTGMTVQQADEMVVVLDRATPEATERVRAWPGLTIIDLPGPPGWRSPCVSFNAGLEAVTGDIVVLNHSDTVHAPGNLEIVRAHFADHPGSVLFGKVSESNPEQLQGPGNAGPLLMGTGNPRPLTWLMACQTKHLRAIGGWDLAYMAGACYEDDDLTTRLWKSGLDFTFNDAFHAVHMTHSRAYFSDFRTLPNMTTFVNRHGCQSAGDVVRRSKPTTTREPDRLTWSHGK